MPANGKLDLKQMGRRIKAARTLRGVTQVEMSGELGITQGTYSQYEHGTVTIGADKLALICAILDVDADWLLGTPHGQGRGPM